MQYGRFKQAMSVGSYPKMDRYLIFKRKADTVEVSNEVYEMKWEMDIEAARFLHALDGKTDPYKISAYMSREEVNQLLEVFEDEWLLSDDDKIIPLGFGTALIPLWTPKITRWYRLIGSLWNKILLFCWIPVFICGIWIFLMQDWNESWNALGIVERCLIVIIGVALHELSHIAACLSYGGRFYELGIMTYCFFPGAYVMITFDNVKKRMKRVQISAAGIESNVLLAGVCLCLLKTGWINTAALLYGAFINVLLAVGNCSLIGDLDGMGICEELLGKGFLKKAILLLKDSRGRARLRKRGINGEITIIACYLIVILQILLPMFILINLVDFFNIFI